MIAGNSKKFILLVLWNLMLIALIMIISNKSYGQYRQSPNFLTELAKDWSIGMHGGRTAFYGDVSKYDEEYVNKITKEGAWAFGVGLSRQLTPIFGLTGEVLLGQLSGSNSRSTFVSNVTEITGHLTVNLLNMFIPENSANFVPYFKMGMGQFTYETKLIFDDPDKVDITAIAKSPEFVYLFGGGAYYMVSNSFNIGVELMGRRMDNDYIDGSTNSSDDDYYSYLSATVTYKINNVPRDTRYYKRMGMKSPLIRRR